MPFAGVTAQSLISTVALIDGVIDYYDARPDGWCQYKMVDEQGRRCLSSAMRLVRRKKCIRGDRLSAYIREVQNAVVGWAPGVRHWNDRCYKYGQIRDLLLSARELVMADMGEGPEPAHPAYLTW